MRKKESKPTQEPKSKAQLLVSKFIGTTLADYLFKHTRQLVKLWGVYKLCVPKFYLVFLVALFSLFNSILSIYTVKAYGDVIDSLIHKKGYEELLNALKMLLLLYVVDLAISIIQDNLKAQLNQDSEMRLKESFLKQILAKDIEFFDSKNSGDITSKLKGELRDIKDCFAWSIFEFFRGISKIIGCFFTLYFDYPFLTLFLIGVTLIRVYFLKIVSARSKNSYKEKNELESKLQTVLQEIFSNIRIVKSFASEDKELKKFKEVLGKQHGVIKTQRANSKYWTLLFSSTKIITDGALFYFGGQMVLAGEMTVGELTSFQSTFKELEWATSGMKWSIESIMQASAAAEKVSELLETPVKVKNSPEAKRKTRQETEGKITFSDIKFAYPTRPDTLILDDFNLEIKKGTTVAFCGSSGSGKSTIVSLLERFYDPLEGRVKIDGIDLKEYHQDWLHETIGYVQQEPALFLGTIKDNITYGVKEATEDQIHKAIDMANAGFIFDESLFPNGLETEVGERGVKLSGGQKQRIAIARTLIKDPKIIILDEATSALDADSEYHVQVAIDNLMKMKDRTVIIIAHRLSTIVDSDMIVVLDHGTIVEKGKHDLLVQKDGFYKKLMEKQLGKGGEKYIPEPAPQKMGFPQLKKSISVVDSYQRFNGNSSLFDFS